MTTRRSCPRCGQDARQRSSWADRHPAAAVTAGLFTLTLMSMMLSVHPVAGLATAGVAGGAGFAVLVDRERQRRAATAARADYQHRALMAAPLASLRQLPQRHTHSLPWQMIRSLRTEPLRINRS